VAENTLTYIINLNGNITKGVLEISGAAQQATGSMDKLKNKIHTIANLGFAVQHVMGLYNKLSGSIDKCVQAYNVQAVAEKKLETLMHNSMGATDAQIQSIKDLTAAQQKLGVIGDEVQLAGAQELSTYLTKTESLKKLIPAMNDMLAQQYGLNATQEQATTIAQMMGKVLDGQVGALSRYGYRFDEAQEKVLKFGTEEQKVAMLSKILTQYVGGVNEALAATPEGKWKQHQNEIGDLRERIGKLFVAVRGALMPVFNAIGELAGRITAFFENNMATVEKIGAVIGGTIVVALNITSGILGVIWDIVSGLFTAMVDSWPFILTATGAYLTYWILINKQSLLYVFFWQRALLWTKIVTAATKLWALATKSVFGVFGLIIGVVTVAVSLFKLFKKGQDETTKAVNSVAAKIGVESMELNRLFEAMKKTEPMSHQRLNLVEQLKQKYPGLIDKMELEKKAVDDLAGAYELANKALARNIFLKEYGEEYTATMKKIGDAKKAAYETMIAPKDKDGNPLISEDKIQKVLTTIDTKGRDIIDAGGYKAGGLFDSGADNSVVKSARSGTIEMAGGWFNPRTGQYPKIGGYGKINKAADEATWKYTHVLLENLEVIRKLQNYGNFVGLSMEELIGAVNGGTQLTGNGGETNPLATTNEAIATGGTRNTTIHINLGKMQAAETITFNGGLKENKEEIQRNMAEVMFRVLGMAETAA